MKGITEIKGIKVGHYTDKTAMTGCTAVLFEGGAVGGVDVRGSAPGTRETDLLRGYNVVERIQAVMLSGGSAYGLDAASGAMQYFEEKNLGTDVSVGVVPIVPAAVIFDLGVGDAHVRPGKAEGYLACKAATEGPVETGSVGAGTGATLGKAMGQEHAAKGGVGTACITLPGGAKLAALVVVNALGDVYDPATGELVAAATVNGVKMPCLGAAALAGAGFGNTTIGVIATDATLTREEANKLASMAHDGLAMAIRPVHTSMDGDTIFGVSTCEFPAQPLLPILAAAPTVMAMAVLDAAKSAEKQA